MWNFYYLGSSFYCNKLTKKDKFVAIMKKYKRLKNEEREKISQLLSQGKTYRLISKALNRNVSTISREVNKYLKTDVEYKAFNTQEKAEVLAKRRNCKRKIDKNEELWNFIKEKLLLRWSPKQISETLKLQYPGDKSMQISHESIYTYLYILPKGELKKELISYLRQKKRLRKNRKGVTDQRGVIPNMISIEERPEEVAERTIPGHWEGDLLMGKDHKSALGSLVERTTRTVILVPLKAKDATTVRKSFAKEMKNLPQQMKLSLTYDRGKEMTEHQFFTKQTQIKVYFCHPNSPWERGTNENTNMLIRDFFPKGTDFSKVSKKEIKKVQNMLNERPRKTLNWLTPKEVFNNLIVAIKT